MFRAFALLLGLLAAACTSQPGESAFKAATDDDAEAVVKSFLDAAESGDPQKLAEHTCDARSARGEDAVLGIKSYEVLAAEPAWSGGEPYFRVDVDVERATGKDELTLSVRAREGCVDRLLGVPLEPARPKAGEIAL